VKSEGEDLFKVQNKTLKNEENNIPEASSKKSLHKKTVFDSVFI